MLDVMSDILPDELSDKLTDVILDFMSLVIANDNLISCQMSYQMNCLMY